jgi:hypothetical protein
LAGSGVVSPISKKKKPRSTTTPGWLSKKSMLPAESES